MKVLNAEVKIDGVEATLEVHNLFRIECLVNGLPQCSFAADATQPFLVPTAGLLDVPAQIRVNGFALVNDELQLVATDPFPLTVAP